MKTVAITGATGFIGGQLVDYCCARGYRVLAFGRRAQPAMRSDVHYTSWDITTPHPRIAEHVDTVIHCAGSVGDWGTYAGMYAANVVGTENVLAAFRDADQFIHISTASVYDPYAPKEYVTEDAPYARRYQNAYGVTKVLAERGVLNSPNRNRIIVRPHAVYGPGDTTLLPRLLRARKLGRYLVLGDGTNVISVTHVTNLCDAIDLMMGAACDGEIFNITDRRVDSINNILSTFVQALGLDAQLLHVPKALAVWGGIALEKMYAAVGASSPPLITSYAVGQLTSHYTLDISKAITLLGYAPQRDYVQGFRELGEWLACNRTTQYGHNGLTQHRPGDIPRS